MPLRHLFNLVPVLLVSLYSTRKRHTFGALEETLCESTSDAICDIETLDKQLRNRVNVLY